MAALSPDNTARFYVTYASANAQHVLENRYDEASMTIDDVSDDTAVLFASLDAAFYAINIIKAEYSAAGSSVRLPAIWNGDLTYGSSAEPIVNVPRQWTLTGKSADGRRWRSTLFCLAVGIPDNWRLSRVTGNLVDLWLPAVSSTAADWLSISGLPVIFNQSATVNENDAWVANQRQG